MLKYLTLGLPLQLFTCIIYISQVNYQYFFLKNYFKKKKSLPFVYFFLIQSRTNLGYLVDIISHCEYFHVGLQFDDEQVHLMC